MKRRIKFEANIFDQLKAFLLQNELEQICFLYCHTTVSNYEITFLPKKIVAFSHDDEAQKQHETGIRLDKDMAHEAYVRFAESDYTALINCHSHPFDTGDNVWFSRTDDAGDKSDTEFILGEIPKWKEHNNKDQQINFLSMVFGQQSIGARTYELENDKFNTVDKIVIIDDPIRYITPTNKKKISLSDESKVILDRQVLAFGEEGQKIISNLKVSIIGIGGLGSILAEGICRLGVRKFVLIDPDTIELSNMNRWQGADYDDQGKYKVEVCKIRLMRMFPDVNVEIIRSDIYNETAVNAIKHSDCIIGGLDNAESRYFLNRLSCQFLIPYIDSGVLIRTENEKITGLDSRMGIVIPSITRCFNCSEVKCYDEEKVRLFFIDADTRNNMTEAGYIQDSEEITAPSVYPLNMMISSMVLFEFLNLFTGYKPVNWTLNVDYLNLNSEKKKYLDTINDYEQRSETCLTCNAYLGTGDSEPLNRFYNRNIKISLPDS